MSVINISYKIEGFLKVYDPNNGEVFVDKHNAINYENMSEAIADALSSRGYGEIYQMAFGNGGSAVDSTGIIHIYHLILLGKMHHYITKPIKK